MLTRLKLQREGKLLVVSSEIMKRRKRAQRPSYSPKVPLKAALEAPQVPYPEVKSEEVQIAQEVEVIEEVQAS